MTNQSSEEFPYTSLDETTRIFSEQGLAFSKNTYPDIPSRIAQLKQLKQVLLAEQQAIITAISDDFGHRSHDETRISELLTLVEAIDSTTKQVKRWSKVSKRKVAFNFSAGAK